MSADNDDEIKPHLDPQAVITLASSIPNCSLVSPPNDTLQNTLSKGSSSAIPSPASISKSETTGSYFSWIQNTFSTEAPVDDSLNKEEENRNEIISFIVSTAYSVEQLTAEADGKYGTRSELEGAGIARVDVYCKTGTVITCRVIQTNHSMDTGSPSDSNVSTSISADNSSIQQQGKENNNNAQLNGIQLRRIIRRKCTLEALRSILSDPPMVVILNSGNDGNNDNDDDDDSQASTVSKKLSKRQQEKKQKSIFSNLTKAQHKFLSQNRENHEKRTRRDEQVRQQMGNAILSGEGSVDFNNLSLTDTVAVTEDTTGTSDAYNAQRDIEGKIEVTDMALAILMGEAQRLERIMEAMKADDNGKGASKDEDGQNSYSTGLNDDTDRSISTCGSTIDQDDADDTDASTFDDEDAHLARIMQGCEIEYSFPPELQDELESALMGDDVVSSSNDDNGDNSDDELESISGRGRRGRSPPRDGNRKLSKRKDDTVSPIVSIPTNGEGCVVLRLNGAFDVIGPVPKVLYKKLFRPSSALPDVISLGTLGRYYVHFRDGSFFFYGPPSLSKILIKKNKKRRGKNRRRDEVGVKSVAFGKGMFAISRFLGIFNRLA